MSRLPWNPKVAACVGGTLIATVAAFAQAPAKKSDTGVVATLTITGCLERWAPEPSVGDAAAAKPPAGVAFMLTDVEGQAVSGTGTPQSAARNERYLLLPNKAVDYAAHLNHRVRIAGTIAPQPSTGASPEQRLVDPASRETNLPPTPESESYDGNLVDVSSLTMVAPSCRR